MPRHVPGPCLHPLWRGCLPQRAGRPGLPPAALSYSAQWVWPPKRGGRMISDPLKALKPPHCLKGWSQSSVQDGMESSTPFYLQHPGLACYGPSSKPLLTQALSLIPPLPTRPTSDHLVQEVSPEDFPGGPGVKTPHFQYSGHGSDPWLWNQRPTCHAVQPRNK